MNNCRCIYCTSQPINLNNNIPTLKTPVVFHFQKGNSRGCFYLRDNSYVFNDGSKLSQVEKVISYLGISFDDICLKFTRNGKIIHIPLSCMTNLNIVEGSTDIPKNYQTCSSWFNYISYNEILKMMDTDISHKKRKIEEENDDLSGAPEIKDFKTSPYEYFHRKNRMCSLESEPYLNQIITIRCTPGACPFVKCEWYIEDETFISEHAASALLMNPKYFSKVSEACKKYSHIKYDDSWDKFDD